MSDVGVHPGAALLLVTALLVSAVHACLPACLPAPGTRALLGSEKNLRRRDSRRPPSQRERLSDEEQEE